LKEEITTLNEIIEKIRKVSLEDVKQIAKRLSAENRYAYWIE
jgi:predicted Zn-dependent peptidase